MVSEEHALLSAYQSGKIIGGRTSGVEFSPTLAEKFDSALKVLTSISLSMQVFGVNIPIHGYL